MIFLLGIGQRFVLINYDTWVCAGIVVRNMLVTYDRFNQQIGFYKTNCTNLWSILPAEAPITAASPVNEHSPVESPVAPPLSTQSPAPLPEGMYIKS